MNGPFHVVGEDDFSWNAATRGHVLRKLGGVIGAPYLRGAKWRLKEENPTTPIDCSGLVRWALSHGDALVPEGSFNQYKLAWKINSRKHLQPLCFGFGDLHEPFGLVDHVNIVFDDKHVIEARADFGRVVLRPIKNWEKQRGFLGWHYLVRLKDYD